MSSLAIVVSVLPLLERGRVAIGVELGYRLDSGGAVGVVDRLGVLDRLGVAVERVLLGWVAIGCMFCTVLCLGSRTRGGCGLACRLSWGGSRIARGRLVQLSRTNSGRRIRGRANRQS